MDPLTTTLAAAAAAASLAGVYLSPALWKPLAIKRLGALCRKKGVLVLTYDDGPGPETTMELLDLLDEFGATATFFISGERLQPHGEVGRAPKRRGHEVGCHAFNHLHAWKNRPGKLLQDFARGMGAAVTAGAEDPVSFRPPFGKIVLPTWVYARQRGTRLAWWTHDSGDSFPELPARSPALDLLEEGGGVALLHDLDRSEARNQFVLQTTRALLVGARERGLTVVTFRELF